LSVEPLLRPRPETVAERIRRLQAEAAQLSRAQVGVLADAISDLSAMAAEVSANPAQPPGIRDLAARLSEAMEAQVCTLTAIHARTS
jgi:hypothetical protein